MYKSNTGHPAKPLRVVLGTLIIQKRKGLSDRGQIKETAENITSSKLCCLIQFKDKFDYAETTSSQKF